MVQKIGTIFLDVS